MPHETKGDGFRDPTYSGRDRAAWLQSAATQLARHGLAPETIAVALHAENVAKCVPPLAMEDLQRFARDAVIYATMEEAHRDSTFEQFAQRVDLLDDGDLEHLPPLTWLVEGVVPAASLALLYGPPGVGKSFVALDLAFCVQTGRAWQGKQIQQGQVIYVLGEGGAGIVPRIRAWKQHHSLKGTAGVLFHRGPLDVLVPAKLDAFIDNVGPRNPRLIVLDTLARCMTGFEEDKSKDMGMFIAGTERLRAELGATVLTVHHPTKDGRSERGSGALRGAMDTVLKLVGSGGVISVQCEKQKDAEEAPRIYVMLEPVKLIDGTTSCVVSSSLPPQSPLLKDAKRVDREQSDHDKARVQQVLGNASNGLTPREIHAALPSVSIRTVYRLLKPLRQCGAVTATKGVYRLANNQTATATPLPKGDSGSGSDT